MPYKDKSQQAIAAKRHYEANKQAIIDRSKESNKKSRLRNREFVKEYMSKQQCIDCGNNNPIVLEFDHVRGEKKYNVSDMIGQCSSIENIQEEISKCEVRCANCHRIVTCNRRNNSSESQI